jgi:hypothetical protein
MPNLWHWKIATVPESTIAAKTVRRVDSDDGFRGGNMAKKRG